MPTDLTQVHDHPARMLDMRNGPTDLFTAHECAEYLLVYERAKGVTFAALDHDALAAVREAFEQVQSAGNAFDCAQAGQDLAEAVNQLLGLRDE